MTATGATSPSRPSCMMAPFPNCFSMAATAAATAFSFSLTFPTPRLRCRMFGGAGARGGPRRTPRSAERHHPRRRSEGPGRRTARGSAGGALAVGRVFRALEGGARERGVQGEDGVSGALHELVAAVHRHAGGLDGRADGHLDDAGSEGPEVRGHAAHRALDGDGDDGDA